MVVIRPALPIDETRYLAAAWEMWWRESFAVPYVNGGYYDGKPPLFFWLMHVGWWMFGVNDWWPRLIAPAFGLGSLFLVRAVAARLWGNTTAAETAPWILLGSVLWAGFCASTMFDMLLGFFALLSVYSIIRAWQDGALRYFALAGLALGLGILAKGPVVFLPALFLVLCSRLWMAGATARRPPPGRWYASALGAAGIAGLIAVAWLVPMAMGSDKDYLLNMTVKQTAGYTVDSFSHARPFWWYVPLLPLVLFPWALWPRAWRAIGAIRGEWADNGVRLCTVWIVAVFAAFSLFSGKQAHYLLLFFPAVALLLARLLPRVERDRDGSLLLPALALAGTGAFLFLAPHIDLRPGKAPWLYNLPETALHGDGGVLVGLAVAVALGRGWSLKRRLALLSASTCATLLVLFWALMRVSSPAYDVRATSAYVAGLQAQGAPLAAISRYDGQYSFYGRLKARVEPVPGPAAEAWARTHSGGYLLSYYHPANWPAAGLPAPAWAERYKGGFMVIWRAGDIVAHPGIAKTFE